MFVFLCLMNIGVNVDRLHQVSNYILVNKTIVSAYIVNIVLTLVKEEGGSDEKYTITA